MMSTEISDNLFDLDDAELASELGVSAEEIAEEKAVIAFVRAHGDQIKAMREARGWTRVQLAEALDVTSARITQLESGTLRNAVSLKMYAKIAHVLGHEPTTVTTKVEDASPGGETPVEADATLALQQVLEDLASAIADASSQQGLRPLAERMEEMLAVPRFRPDASSKFEMDIPESFNVLVREVRELRLDMEDAAEKGVETAKAGDKAQ